MIFIVVITLYPLIFVFSASISDPILVSTGQMLLFPKGVTLSGYEKLFEYTDLWVGYANTILYTVGGTLLNLLVTLPCAYALSRKDFKAKNVVMIFFVITMYFGGGLIPTYLNIKSFGLVDTRACIMLMGLVSTSNLIVCRTFFQNSIPWELQEASMIDGASDMRIFINVVIPLSKPIIAVMAMYYGVAHWNSYFTPMVYLKTRSKFPLQLILKEILTDAKLSADSLASAIDAEEVAAMMKISETANLLKYGVIVLSTLPMMIIYPFLQKYFEKGVMIGSVKGYAHKQSRRLTIKYYWIYIKKVDTFS